tara:strand:+ start:765 stop:1478 length:714 start_codon:yes stop_codon:yes gene_type:complete
MYSKYPHSHIFDINLDEFKYKLTFNNIKIGPAIVQRIEGRREPETTSVYRSIIQPGMKVMELGACYGEFTILIDHLVGENGQLISVEGTPNIFKILERNISINNLKNTKIYQTFIKNSKGVMVFNKDETHVYNAIKRSSKDSNKDSNSLEKVECEKLTDFMKRINFYPEIIVMDIEGYEEDVIEDLFLINKTNYYPILLFEIHENFYNKNIDYLEAILSKNNYIIRKIKDNNLCYQA